MLLCKGKTKMKNRYEMVHIKMQRINARGLYNLAQQRKKELEKRDDAHDNRHLHYVLVNLKDMMDALETGAFSLLKYIGYDVGHFIQCYFSLGIVWGFTSICSPKQRQKFAVVFLTKFL